MKRFLTLYIFLFSAWAMQAQQPIFVPNLIATDWEGDTVNLYSILDEGRLVYFVPLGLSYDLPTDTTSFWYYYSGNKLQAFWEQHGPMGTNEGYVIALTTGMYEDIVACCGSESPGNWQAVSPFPLISVNPDGTNGGGFINYLHNAFGIGIPLWDKIFRICPDRSITRLDYLPTAAELEQEMNVCTFAEAAHDAKLLAVQMDRRPLCEGESRDVSVKVSNFGTDTLHSVTVTLKDGDATLLSYDWVGDLPTYHSTDIALGTIVGSGDTISLATLLSNPNGSEDMNTANDTLSDVLLPSKLWGEDTIFVDIMTDGYGPQFYWDIKTEDGITIDSGGNVLVGMLDGEGAPVNVGTSYLDFTHYTKKVFIGNHGQECLTIRVLSGYGYGICCQYGSGYARFKTSNETVFEFQDFGRRAYGKLFTTFDALPPFETSYAVVHTSEALANGSIAVTATGGVPPYEYSISCGDTFGSTPNFDNLPAGWYCLSTRDAINQTLTDSIEVFSSVSETETASGRLQVSVRPNPANETAQIGITLSEASDVQVSVYNVWGQRVLAQPTVILPMGTNIVAVDVSHLVPGLYVVVVQGKRRIGVAKFLVE